MAQAASGTSYFGLRNDGLTFNEYVVQVSLEAETDLESVVQVGDVKFENALLLKSPSSSYAVPGGAITNGYSAELDVVIRLHFVSAVRSVAFQLFAQRDFASQTNPFLEAFLGSTSLGRFEIASAQTLVGLPQSEALGWFGLENSVFDRLDISAPVATITPDGAPPFTQVQSVGLTNIQYEELAPAPVEVPEPGTLALLAASVAAAGLAGLAGLRRVRIGA